jgi:hypothetical protein
MLACMKTLKVLTATATTDPVQGEPELATQQPTEVDMSTTEATTKTFLIRGLVAIAWAAVFAAVSDSLTTGVTVGAGILLVLYPLIDAVASLIDARSQHGSTRRLLLANAVVSAVAAGALGVAATGSVADVLVVFGAWAAITGAAQVVVQAWLLARRSRPVATVPAGA